jgi:hypothetical protein
MLSYNWFRNAYGWTDDGTTATDTDDLNSFSYDPDNDIVSADLLSDDPGAPANCPSIDQCDYISGGFSSSGGCILSYV